MQNPDLNRAVKPHLISVFGEVAGAVGKHFIAYLVYVMTLVIQAAATTVPVRCVLRRSITWCFPFSSLTLFSTVFAVPCIVQLDDDDLVDFLYDLRYSIMEAFVGIVQNFASIPECGTHVVSR